MSILQDGDPGFVMVSIQKLQESAGFICSKRSRLEGATVVFNWNWLQLVKKRSRTDCWNCQAPKDLGNLFLIVLLNAKPMSKLRVTDVQQNVKKMNSKPELFKTLKAPLKSFFATIVWKMNKNLPGRLCFFVHVANDLCVRVLLFKFPGTQFARESFILLWNG